MGHDFGVFVEYINYLPICQHVEYKQIIRIIKKSIDILRFFHFNSIPHDNVKIDFKKKTGLSIYKKLICSYTVEPRHSYASLFVQLAIRPTCSHNF